MAQHMQTAVWRCLGPGASLGQWLCLGEVIAPRRVEPLSRRASGVFARGQICPPQPASVSVADVQESPRFGVCMLGGALPSTSAKHRPPWCGPLKHRTTEGWVTTGSLKVAKATLPFVSTACVPNHRSIHSLNPIKVRLWGQWLGWREPEPVCVLVVFSLGNSLSGRGLETGHRQLSLWVTSAGGREVAVMVLSAVPEEDLWSPVEGRACPHSLHLLLDTQMNVFHTRVRWGGDKIKQLSNNRDTGGNAHGHPQALAECGLGAKPPTITQDLQLSSARGHGRKRTRTHTARGGRTNRKHERSQQRIFPKGRVSVLVAGWGGSRAFWEAVCGSPQPTRWGSWLDWKESQPVAHVPLSVGRALLQQHLAATGKACSSWKWERERPFAQA